MVSTTIRSYVLTVCCLFGAVCIASTATAADKPSTGKTAKVTYDDHVKPILRAKCFSCHRPDKKEGDLDLTNFTALMEGGGSGEVVEAGSLDGSYFWELVSHASEPYMPPESDKLPDAELAVIRAWIEGGTLENSGSKAVAKKTFDFGLKAAPSGRPAGPAAMPQPLNFEPVVHSPRATAVTAVATSPWAPLAAIAGQKQVLLYNTQTLQLAGIFPFAEGIPHVLKFSRSGDLLLAGGGRGSANGRVVVWNVKTGERVIEIGDEFDTVLAADISSDQTLIALGGPGRIVRVYDTSSGELAYALNKHTDWVYSLEFSPDGVLLATGDRAGGMFVWEAHTGRLYSTLNGHKGPINDISWRSDSNLVASCSEDQSIRLWEMENGRNIKTWNAHSAGTASVDFARDGRLVSCGRDKVTKLWDQNGKQLIAFSAFSDLALRTAICNETNRVIAGDWTGEVRVWNVADGKVLGTLSANPVGLDEKQKQAGATLAERQAAQVKLAAAATASQVAASKVKADLAAATKSVVTSKQQIATAKATSDATRKVIAALQAQIAAQTKTQQALKIAAPLLIESVKKAAEAAAKLPQDKALAAAAAGLKTQSDAKSAALKAADTGLATSQANLKKSQEQLAAADKLGKDAAARLPSEEKRVVALTAAVKPATDNATAAKQAADQALAALRSSQALLERIKVQIDLRDQQQVLTTQLAELTELQSVEQTATEALEKARIDMTNGNKAVAAGVKQRDAAVATQKQATTNVGTAEQTLKNTQQANTALKTLLPLLQDAVAKTDAAKATGDKDVAAAAAAIKGVLDKKAAALAAGEKANVAQTTALATSRNNLIAAQKATEKATQDLVVLQKKSQGLESAVPPAEKAAAAAKQTTAASAAKVESTRKAISALQAKIAPPAPQKTAAK